MLKEGDVGLKTMQIQVAVAWADIMLGYVGYILRHVAIPAVVCGAIGWLIGRLIGKRR